jgi:hypothetical protein
MVSAKILILVVHYFYLKVLKIVRHSCKDVLKSQALLLLIRFLLKTETKKFNRLNGNFEAILTHGNLNPNALFNLTKEVQRKF